MSTKLNVAVSIAVIASALLFVQQKQSVAAHSAANRIATSNVESPSSPDKAKTLATSSIIPAFIPNRLPVANMVDVAADIAIQQLTIPSGAADHSRVPALKSTPKAPTEGVRRQVNDVSGYQQNAGNDNAQLPVRSHADVAFLKRSQTNSMNNGLATVPNIVLGSPAVRTMGTIDQNNGDNNASTAYSSHLKKTSTVHRHLQNFKALLNPQGFLREHWQDISIAANLGHAKTDIQPFIVMIDPGHGGVDQGAKGHNGLLEKDLTLDIARRVRLFLTEQPQIDVKLTRHHDHGLSRQSRVDAIQRSKADMVISLHFNHLPQTDVNLVESYYAGVSNINKSMSKQQLASQAEFHHTGTTGTDVDLGFTDGSARLAKTLQQHIFSEVSFENNHVQNAGVKQETFFVLTRSFTPAALIEISCLSHAGEADRLASDEYRNRLAAALVDGIRNYHDSIQRVPLKKAGALGA